MEKRMMETWAKVMYSHAREGTPTNKQQPTNGNFCRFSQSWAAVVVIYDIRSVIFHYRDHRYPDTSLFFCDVLGQWSNPKGRNQLFLKNMKLFFKRLKGGGGVFFTYFHFERTAQYKMLNNSSAIQRFYLFIVIFHRLQKEHQQLHLWFLQHIDLIHFFLVSKFYTCDSEEKESTKEYQTDNGGRKTNFEKLFSLQPHFKLFTARKTKSYYF